MGQCKAHARGELGQEDVDVGCTVTGLCRADTVAGMARGRWWGAGLRLLLHSQVPFSVSVCEQRLLKRASGLLWAALHVD